MSLSFTNPEKFITMEELIADAKLVAEIKGLTGSDADAFILSYIKAAKAKIAEKAATTTLAPVVPSGIGGNPNPLADDGPAPTRVERDYVVLDCEHIVGNQYTGTIPKTNTGTSKNYTVVKRKATKASRSGTYKINEEIYTLERPFKDGTFAVPVGYSSTSSEKGFAYTVSFKMFDKDGKAMGDYTCGANSLDNLRPVPTSGVKTTLPLSDQAKALLTAGEGEEVAIEVVALICKTLGRKAYIQLDLGSDVEIDGDF